MCFLGYNRSQWNDCVGTVIPLQFIVEGIPSVMGGYFFFIILSPIYFTVAEEEFLRRTHHIVRRILPAIQLNVLAVSLYYRQQNEM